MTEIEQVKKAILNRLSALKKQGDIQNNYMLKMHAEELEALFEMWERAANVDTTSSLPSGE